MKTTKIIIKLIKYIEAKFCLSKSTKVKGFVDMTYTYIKMHAWQDRLLTYISYLQLIY